MLISAKISEKVVYNFIHLYKYMFTDNIIHIHIYILRIWIFNFETCIPIF